MTADRTHPPIELTLHIGSGKTGTSSIQLLLGNNRARLAEHGLLFPRTPGKARHVRLGMLLLSDEQMLGSAPWRRIGSPDPAVFRDRFRRRLVREIRRAGLPRVLLTDEALFGASAAGMDQLGGLVGRFAAIVRLLVYLRRQDDHLISRYQQVVKTGSVERLEDYARRDFTSVYDYHARLSMWRQRLAPDELVVRVFESDRFEGGSLIQDFLTAARIDVPATELEQVGRRNDSLDAECVELLRVLNLHWAEHHGTASEAIDNRPLFLRLDGHSHGPVLTLPGPVLDDFMLRWDESNQRVARDFLGDASGRLFRSDRKTSGTTTEQRLDPARLDHYLEILEIPEQEHAAIRRVAEREASRS